MTIFDSTEAEEELYLAFSAGGISYVLPLSDVGQVTADISGDMERIVLPGSAKEALCALIFQDDSGVCALLTDEVTGIVRIPASCQYELPEEACSRRNSWICGLAYLEQTKSLSYLLNCRKLRERFCGEA